MTQLFQSDPLLSKFTAEPFDASAYTSHTVRSSSVRDALAGLSRGLSQLDHELNSQVAAHHEELLGQVSTVSQLESMLEVVRGGVDSLQASIDKVSTEIRQPAAAIEQRTSQLRRVQQAAQLVRRVGRYSHECSRLRAHLRGGPRDLAHAAQCLDELDRLAADGALQGVAVVDAELAAVSEARHELQRRAQQLLEHGLHQLDASDTQAAVDVLERLHAVDARSDAVRMQELRQLRDTWRAALLQAQQAVQQAGSAAGQHQVWPLMAGALDALHASALRVWHLDGVVASRWLQQQQQHRPRAGLAASAAAAGASRSAGSSVAGKFWLEACQQIVQPLLAQAMRDCAPLEQLLVVEYPRLHRMLCEAVQRLQQHFELRHRAMSADEQAAWLATVRTVHDAYVARAFGRLSDAVQRMFGLPAGAVPSAEDTQALAVLLANEIELARTAGAPLDVALQAAAAKALKLFAAKAEPLIGTDASAFALADQGPTATQQRNAKLFGRLQQLHAATLAALDGRTPAEPTLLAALEKLRTVAAEIVGSLCQQLFRQFDGSLLLMLRDDFSMKEASDKDSASGSKYMHTLASQLARAQQVLGLYAAGPWRQPPLSALATRLLQQFVRLATLIRPVAEGGKLKLTQDMIRLELAIAPLAQAKQLGAAYAALRALRPLLFCETAAIADSPQADWSQVPLSALLNHVISRAAPGLPSVHAWNQWSISQYAQWLETHSDAEACALIRRALDGYVQQVNQRGERQFDAVYPTLVRLLESRKA
eukprot:TRINITY_DN763_c0_g1_i1.p1 TRINITY_DN763_c0_g1~~TRINITY_DN763_c0_g1_i1.p1  ORF type:complete len:766 (+),score=293.31 TRINITY_DN763_c0_g1_i1:171-2468(+)